MKMGRFAGCQVAKEGKTPQKAVSDVVTRAGLRKRAIVRPSGIPSRYIYFKAAML